MSKGGTRLNKILGTEEGTEINNDSGSTTPIKEAKMTASGKSENSNDSNIKIRPNSHQSDTKKKNRISSILSQNDEDDPPVSGLDGFDEHEISLESNNSPFQEFTSDENIEKDMENLLNKILQGSNHDQHGHGQSLNTFDDSNSLFPNNMSSIFPPGMGSKDGIPIFPGMSGMPGMSGVGKPEKCELDIAKSKLYKSSYSIFRFIIVWIIVSIHIEKSSILSSYIFAPNSKLWIHFLSAEVLLGAIYLLLSYLSVFPNHTILSFDVSNFGYPNSILTSYGLVKSFFTDFCFMIVLLVFLFYFKL